MAATGSTFAQGIRLFSIGTNICEWFELGAKKGTDHWLEAQIVGEGEFLFNGRLFLPRGAGGGTVIDNFPKGPAPKGWTKRARLDQQGYELVSDGTVLFGYHVAAIPIPGRDTESGICFVTVNIYDVKGTIIAESLPNEFRLHRGPAMIGHGGIHFS